MLTIHNIKDVILNIFNLTFLITVAKRRLAFLNKEGFDRFGKNKLFAPLIKWDAYKKQVEDIKNYAKVYEDAYNTVQASIEGKENIKEILKALPEPTKVQVENQKKRLTEAKTISLKEKNAYVPVS